MRLYLFKVMMTFKQICNGQLCAFINSYFIKGLQAGEAGIDIQPVFNHYTAVVHICGLLPKPGSEFSSYEIELRNQVTQNDVTLRVTNSKIFIEILLFSY